ncbi:MAG: metalloregulator ArsR/SmtB family transcription factor [Verrucomicrobiota bacterium]|nr:metalloregulator ArsR/SmtB family transcription factor [Verrucomicrobiota bacterium]
MSKPRKPKPAYQADAVFKALGHPARVTIIRELSAGECCVCDLVEAVGLGWSTVSRHLSVLRDAGVILDEKRGVQVFYRLQLPCVSRFIACLDQPSAFPDLMTEGCGCK